MHYRTWNSVIVIAVFAAWFLSSPVIAACPVPTCRLDDELTPFVQLAADWGLQDLKQIGKKLPFDKVAINPRGAVPARTLPIYIVKDAGASTLDEKGCIKPILFVLKDTRGATPLWTDGPCVSTKLDACGDGERNYMALRMREIANWPGDSQIGYESAGACYMTNQHACLHRDRLDLVAAVGPRDEHSVRGMCVADAMEPVQIRCSAGALKWLLNSEAVEAKQATTLAMVVVLSHELGHLSSDISSRYDAIDNVFDLTWKSTDKITRIQKQCMYGDIFRGNERDADKDGMHVATRRLTEIARKWPNQGSQAWLITQAGHQSTNVVRFNNDWFDEPKWEVPDAFRQNPGGGLPIMTAKELKAILAGKMVSGRSPQEVQLAARKFLCELTKPRAGWWYVPLQSGSSHGTLAGRLREVILPLRSVKFEEDSRAQRIEGLSGLQGDAFASRHWAYLRELEGAICTLVEQPLDCSEGSLTDGTKTPAPTSEAPKTLGGSTP